MTQISQITGSITETTISLTPTIPLNVYFVQGTEQGVFVDSGIQSMREDLMSTLATSKVDLMAVLHTHSHHDHIGSSGFLQKETGCQIVAPRQYAHWHQDWEAHYREFARPFPSIFTDTPALREEVLGILDQPHQVDRYCQEGDYWDLGGGVVLQCLGFSGHMLEEVGWLETSSGTLILGDVVTLLDAPFIHGHLTVAGYRGSLGKLQELIKHKAISTVLMAHFPPMDPDAFLSLIDQAEVYLTTLETTVLNVVKQGVIDLEDIWLKAIKALGKDREFRSLSTVDAHLKDLDQQGQLIYENQRVLLL